MNPGLTARGDALEQELRLAANHLARGELVDAERNLLGVVAAHSSAVALTFLSMIANATGRGDLALERARAAVALDPRRPECEFSLGRAYKSLGRLDDAIAAYERALNLHPGYVDALVSLGIALRLRGELEAAIAAYRRALTLRPDHPEALGNLGNALAERLFGEHARLVSGEDLREAIEVQRRALRLSPGSANLMHNLALSLKQAGRYEEATELFNRALGSEPARADTCLQFGDLLFKEQRPDLARELFERWLADNPPQADVQMYLANVLSSLGELDQATVWLDRAAALRPGWHVVEHLRGRIRSQQFHVEDDVDSTLAHFRQALEARPDYFEAICSYLLTLCYVEEDPLRLLDEHRRRIAALGAPRRALPPDPSGWPARRLRVGYVSHDFKRHSVAYFVEGVLESHDRTRFEVFAYKTNGGGDATTERLRGACEHWAEASHLSDEQLAERIRADRIDVVVDLTGLTSGSRLVTFNRRAAACQVTYLGYPTSSGAPCFDFRLSDAVIDPPGSEGTSSEAVLRHPHSMFCYRPGPLPDTGPLPAIRNGFVTFGSFNNQSKVGPRTLELWVAVLRAVPRSRLLLKSQALLHHGSRLRLQRHFGEQDVDPARIVLLPWQPAVQSHLSAYQDVDIGLDTYPFNGATTTCEALSMGVPVVTLAGRTHASRMGASILGAAGLGSCIATTRAGYVEAAVRMARDLDALAQLRAGMRTRLAGSRLQDKAAFTRDHEALLVRAFEATLAASDARP
jgi:predicted O-linked N-acetylglucosamine transferase (SPINDLY family)